MKTPTRKEWAEAFVGIQEALQGLDGVARTTVLLTLVGYQMKSDGIPAGLAVVTVSQVIRAAYAHPEAP